MTTPQEGQELTRVGPGTVMGDLMRRYWIPAALSSELKADGDPVRLMLLGEKLIAFRDSAGKVGIMDHRCPHRCASLFFGRNEEGGIRCVYHGWKFDTEGRCTDMPNLPAHQDFKDKVRAKAYPTAERNGLVWVYMGAEEAPRLPELEATLLPAEDVQLTMIQRECNWLQGLEGDIDTSHFSWLHIGSIKPEDMDPTSASRYNALNRAPEYHTADTDWGTMYGAFREAEGDDTYWRIAHFMFPFWTITPESPFSHQVAHRAWVPMDDTHTMMLGVVWKGRRVNPRVDRQGRPFPGAKPGGIAMQPNSTDWFGRWRPVQNAANDYLIDRDVQRNGSYTGIESIIMQDQAVTESMGPITDHGFEHLAPSDRMITQTRRRLLRAARALRDTSAVPPASDKPSVYLGARGGEFLAPRPLAWPDVYQYALGRIADPTGRFSQAAE